MHKNRSPSAPTTLPRALRLALLTRDGRSQARVIEEALDRMPMPTKFSVDAEREALIASLKDIIATIPPGSVPSLAEFDAEEYDEHGDPR